MHAPSRLLALKPATALLRRPQLPRACSAMVATLADDTVATASTAAASPYVAVYITLLVVLVSGVAYLLYQDSLVGKRKREAVEQRADMVEKLREQGMVKEAEILEAERQELAAQLAGSRPTFVWDEVSKAAKRRAEAEQREAGDAGTKMNREERRQMAKMKRREEKKKAKEGSNAA